MPAESTSLGTATLDVQPVYQPGITADAATIADLVNEAKSRELLEVVEGRRYVVVTADGQEVHELNVDPEQFAEQPFSKRGTVNLADPDSFVTYVNRHSLERATTLWGSIDTGTVTAVFDDHASRVDHEQPGSAGWGRHRGVLTLRSTTDWQHWLKLDGRFVSQDEFAEHIEDGVDAIVNPDAATMLEIAQTFQAHTGANIESGRRLSGEVQFRYTEQTTAGAGEHGSIEIPDGIELALAPFEGNDPYPISARFRFRIVSGKLTLGYRLIRPDRLRRLAFDDIVATVSAASGLPVMAGTPRSA